MADLPVAGDDYSKRDLRSTKPYRRTHTGFSAGELSCDLIISRWRSGLAGPRAVAPFNGGRTHVHERCFPTRTHMEPDEPIEHTLLRNAVAAEVTVTNTEVSPTSTGDRYVRIEGRLGNDEESHV